MKGQDEVIEALNRALTVELTAINQYFCQAKMCKNWGFMKLAAKHYEGVKAMAFQSVQTLLNATLFFRRIRARGAQNRAATGQDACDGVKR